MADTPLTILLVEDDPQYARLVAAALARTEVACRVEHVPSLKPGIERLAAGGVDAVLLDLDLPDASGLDTFRQTRAAAPEVAIVVLTGLKDEEIAVEAVRAGAQDYLFKGQLDARLLPRAIRYAIQRHQTQLEQQRRIERLAILRDVDDELTRRLDLEYVLVMAVDTALRLSAASAALIGLLEEDGLVRLEYINYTPELLARHDILKEGIIARSLRRRQPELVADVAADPDYLPLLPKTRAQIAIPLISQDRLVGFLSLEASDPARFTEETFEFVKLLAARIATAVDNARLYRATQAQLAELKELYAQVSNLEQMKTTMIRIAAHDLRNPLSNIMGYLYLLRSEALPPTALSYLDHIQRSVERMQMITNNVLSLERLEALRDTDAQAVRLSELVEKAFLEHEGQARHKAQRFSLLLPAEPVVVRGDAALLYEAIVNLISNALKYTPEGGRVEVRLQRAAQEAVFEVEDTGYGIPADQQALIFQPFFRVRSKETLDINGTGLGLHLVKNIIDHHHGAMRFHSVYGQGSTLGFRLPLVQGR